MRAWTMTAMFLLGGIVVAAASNVQPEAAAETPRSLQISIPAEIDPASVIIRTVQYAAGLTRGTVKTKPGVQDYAVSLAERTKRVRLLVYSPGFKMVTADLDVESGVPTQPFVPVFEPLASVPLRIRLTDSAGRPLAAETVALEHDLQEMRWLEVVNMLGMPARARVASGKTDEDGVLAVTVPSLLDDPNLVAQVRQFRQDMRGDQDRLIHLAQFLQQFPDFNPRSRVQPRGRRRHQIRRDPQ